MPNFNATFPDYTGDYKKDFLNIQDSFISLKKSFDYYLSHLNEDNIYQMTGENGDVIFDRQSFNSVHAKWFKNMCENSNFEIFDTTTLIPYGWDGGVVTSTSNFFGTYSLKLAITKTSTQTYAVAVNPAWYADQSDTTRVALYKKGGAVKVYVLDRDTDVPYTVTDKNDNEGTYIEFPYNANWGAEKYTLTCVPTGATRIKLKFENSDASYGAYIDAVIIEPDYNGNRPSLYTDGPNSVGNVNGENISNSSVIIKDYYVTNSAQVVVTTSETTILTKTFTLLAVGTLKTFFTCQGASDDALSTTFLTYIDTVAKSYQPKVDMFGNSNVLATYNDTKESLAAGDHTVAIKGITTNNTFTIEALFANMDLLIIPLITSSYELPVTITETHVLEYGTTENGTDNNLIKISSTLWAHFFKGTNSKINVDTYVIDADYNMSRIDAFASTHTESQSYYGAIMINSTHFAIAFNNYISSPSSNEGLLKTYSVDSSADNIALIDTSAAYGSPAWYNSFSLIDSTHLILAFSGSGADGYITTFSIDANADNITSISELEHDTGNGTYNSLITINATHVALAYAGVGDDGYIKIFSIDGAYAITQIAELEHDTGNGTWNSFVMIDTTHFILAYTSSATTGYIKVFSIDGAYAITEVSSFKHEATSCSYNSLAKINSTHFALAYTGVDDDGYIKTFAIDGAYNIKQTGVLEHEIAYADWNSLICIDNTHLGLAYCYGANRKLKTFTLS